MNKSTILKKKLLSQHLLQVADDAVTNESLINILWSFRQGETLALTAETLPSLPLERYGLEYTVTRGPKPDHWLRRNFNPAELVLLFAAKEDESIAHSWLLFNDESNDAIKRTSVETLDSSEPSSGASVPYVCC